MRTQNRTPAPPAKLVSPSKNHQNNGDIPCGIREEEPAGYRQLIARATNDAVRDWNLETDALEWDQGIRTLLGYEQDAALGTMQSWQGCVHPGDRARVVASLRAALDAQVEQWSMEYRFQCANGHYLHLLERACIVRNSKGGASRFVGVLMDVSACKQLQDQLCRSQKMEAFGQLAAGMAHDFNNFLTTILGYSDLIVADVQGRGTVAKYISEIRSAAGRAALLTGHLLAFSRRQPLELRVLEVNRLVHDLERSILRLLGENIPVVCELFPRKQFIEFDPNQFTQIMVNLAVNARDAMPGGGTLRLKTSNVAADGTDPLLPELTPGEYVVLSMIDTGVGMTEEVKAHLFEPFFSTKSEGQGSGLGLAACYGIVRQCGGHILICSEAGKGTAVHLYLPQVAPPKPAAYKKARTSAMPTGHETVLVLEDDPSVRHVAVRTLTLLGYRVLEACEAEQARRCLMQDSERVDLVVSDIVLPDTSGRDFAAWTRQHSPHTRIVLISGYLTEFARGIHEDGLFFLPKPFDPQQLATIVRRALDLAVTR